MKILRKKVIIDVFMRLVETDLEKDFLNTQLVKIVIGGEKIETRI